MLVTSCALSQEIMIWSLRLAWCAFEAVGQLFQVLWAWILPCEQSPDLSRKIEGDSARRVAGSEQADKKKETLIEISHWLFMNDLFIDTFCSVKLNDLQPRPEGLP